LVLKPLSHDRKKSIVNIACEASMDLSPDTLRELAQYLRNSAQLFPSPRTKKAFEWLIIKADEADNHAAAWEADRARLKGLRQLLQAHLGIEDAEIEAMLADEDTPAT
jgi:hypothetical protein